MTTRTVIGNRFELGDLLGVSGGQAVAVSCEQSCQPARCFDV